MLPSLKVLAIDDDEVDVELLRRYLKLVPGHHFQLRHCSSDGSDCEEALRDGADLIFLDYVLADRTCAGLLRTLRAEGLRTPVIVLSGRADESVVAEMMKAGATDYLAKARMLPESLEQVVRNALRVGELQREAARAEEKLRLAAQVFDNAVEGIIVTDAQERIVSVNPAFTAITGYAAAEVMGRTPRILASGRHDQAYFEAMWRQLIATGHWRGEVWNRRRNGEIFPAWQTLSLVRDARGEIEHFVSVLFDITERKRYEEVMRHQANYDALTDLPNRALLDDRLRLAMAQAKRDRGSLAVMFVDLDRFKEVNDRLGHAAGDRLLQDVAVRLRGCLREGDTVARLGGDEFILLLPRIACREDAERVAGKILACLPQTLPAGDGEIRVGGSIGIAAFPDHGTDPAALLRRADEAMYQTKQGGRGSFRWATDS